MFKKLSLNAKLIFMFSLCAFILLMVGGIGVFALHQTRDYFTHVVNINAPNTIATTTMKSRANDSLRLLLQTTLPGNDEKEIARLTKKIRDEQEKFKAMNEEYLKIDFAPGEKEVYEPFIAAWKDVLKHSEEGLALASTGSPADRAAFGNLYRGDFQRIRLDFYAKNDALIQFHQEQGALWTKKALDTAQLQSNITMLLVAVGFLLSLAMGIIFSRSLSRQLVSVSENMVSGASQVNAAASEIATSSESLSSSASEQAAAVQQTSSAVEELSAMVSKNSDNAEKSREKAATSQEVAQKGRTVVSEMMTAISEINESNTNIMNAVEESNKNISDITRVIMDIGAKTTVIKDIVFQTKLLSFNASVEAARAGEHGKGFSVVAEEVGNLAQMSGNAAQEISSTLEQSIKKVNEIVAQTKQRVEVLIHHGKEKVERGHAVATQCGEILEQIVAEASDVSSMVVEISGSSKEQSIGIQEITKAMSQMDVVTQQNASVSQTSASASVELAAQSESLTSLVSEMQMIIYGLKGPSVKAVRAPLAKKVKNENQQPSAKIVQFRKSKSPLGVPAYDDIKVSGDE